MHARRNAIIPIHTYYWHKESFISCLGNWSFETKVLLLEKQTMLHFWNRYPHTKAQPKKTIVKMFSIDSKRSLKLRLNNTLLWVKWNTRKIQINVFPQDKRPNFAVIVNINFNRGSMVRYNIKSYLHSNFWIFLKVVTLHYHSALIDYWREKTATAPWFAKLLSHTHRSF